MLSVTVSFIMLTADMLSVVQLSWRHHFGQKHSKIGFFSKKGISEKKNQNFAAKVTMKKTKCLTTESSLHGKY